MLTSHTIPCTKVILASPLSLGRIYLKNDTQPQRNGYEKNSSEFCAPPIVKA